MAESKKKTILVIDDDANDRDLIARKLRKAGYHVVCKANVADALVYAEKCMHVIGLVLSDLKMVGNGHKLAMKFRDLEGAEHIPLCALSDYTWEFNREKARKSGFDGCITKGTSFDRLEEQVRAFLQP